MAFWGTDYYYYSPSPQSSSPAAIWPPNLLLGSPLLLLSLQPWSAPLPSQLDCNCFQAADSGHFFCVASSTQIPLPSPLPKAESRQQHRGSVLSQIAESVACSTCSSEAFLHAAAHWKGGEHLWGTTLTLPTSHC